MRATPHGAVGITSIACFGGCLSCVVALHVLRSDLDPLGHRLSEYANGPYGAVMTAAFWMLGLGSMSLARELRLTLHLPGTSRLVPVLLAVSGVGMVVSGVFETRGGTPPTLTEIIHSRASGTALVTLIAAAVLLAARPPNEPGPAWGSTVLAVLAAAVGGVSPLLHDSRWTGAVQRLLGLTLVTWLVVTASWVRQLRLARQ